jgi:hypothetical protein
MESAMCSYKTLCCAGFCINLMFRSLRGAGLANEVAWGALAHVELSRKVDARITSFAMSSHETVPV